MRLVTLCKNQIPLQFFKRHFEKTGDELIDIYNMFQFRAIVKEEKFDYFLSDRFALEYYPKLGTGIREHADKFYFLYYEQNMTAEEMLIYWMAYNNVQQMDNPEQTEVYEKLEEFSSLLGASEETPAWYKEMPKADKRVFNHFFSNSNEEIDIDRLALILYDDKSPSKINSLYVHIHNIREILKKHLNKSDILVRTEKTYYMLDALKLDVLPQIEELEKPKEETENN